MKEGAEVVQVEKRLKMEEGEKEEGDSMKDEEEVE